MLNWNQNNYGDVKLKQKKDLGELSFDQNIYRGERLK
jgi:hypothetical protein